MGKKIKKVVAMTPVGEKEFYFEIMQNVDPDEVVCKTRCPHGKYCRVLPDPTDPTNNHRKFSDFCGELSEKNGGNGEYDDMIPCEGCVEEIMKDVIGEDIFEAIIKNNKMVPIKDVIRTVCSGFCDEYDEEFKNCNSQNCSCILSSLLKNRDVTQPDVIGADGIPDVPADEEEIGIPADQVNMPEADE